MTANRRLLSVYAVLAFFTVLAGDAWRYSITWFGFGAVVLIVVAFTVVLLVKQRDHWRFNDLPYPLVAFVALALLSTAWSFYPQWTAVGAVTTVMTVTAALAIAVTFTLPQILRLLGHALRIVLGLSILFELFVSVIIRHPILPWWTDYTGLKVHPADYWSRDLLFHGKQIQGIVGNSNLLGFIALLGLIVFAIEFASRSLHRGWAGFWVVVAVADILLTRSATVTVAIIVVAAVTIVLLLLRQAKTARGRSYVGIGAIAVVAIVAASAVVFNHRLLELLGKSSDLTGRTRIWGEVIHLASQRPFAGWGWISYWLPGLPPFNNHAFVNGGVELLQAHEAWLDVWLQLGIVGLIVFAALVISTLVRAWILAVDRPQLGRASVRRHSAVSLLPVLLLVALLAQSLAESRLLIEYGMLLLALIAIKTKHQDPVVET
jgi:exopolysaccharide production protein ExoQ